MGCRKSKVSTHEGFIEYVKNEDKAELCVQEHKDLINKKKKVTFSASTAAEFGDCQNENEGLLRSQSRRFTNTNGTQRDIDQS
ncbi:unnamed protein product [Euphydryas editha]|uniref:Uncharacterized protein n=1 Tax=Euphydryas editha TaxID=104508 RepID=A0AAU9U9D6_EUPED|nr:unnamed protein product [Euphydryas editha]